MGVCLAQGDTRQDRCHLSRRGNQYLIGPKGQRPVLAQAIWLIAMRRRISVECITRFVPLSLAGSEFTLARRYELVQVASMGLLLSINSRCFTQTFQDHLSPFLPPALKEPSLLLPRYLGPYSSPSMHAIIVCSRLIRYPRLYKTYKMSALQVTLEQFHRLPILIEPVSCSGKTYIVTGSNHGIGLETARHLVRCSAERVILAVRNIAAGQKAKADIETSTGRTGVADVWHLDLASFSSVKAFVTKACGELERIDALIENAGVMLDQFKLVEGMETCMTVNVVSTVLLGQLMMPKLSEVARQSGIKPRLVFVVSTLGFVAGKELKKSGKVNIFDGMNDPKRADMDQRYALTKLVEMYVVREFAAAFPVERTGVVVNMVAPGLCSTGLGHDARTWTRIWVAAVRILLARTAEQGSRTILHGIVAGNTSHGKLLSGCQIKEYWIPTWMTNTDGLDVQRQLWKELVIKMEIVLPGCTS